MANKFDFDVRLTRKEYSALSDIRGLEEASHMMVMTADIQENGERILQGSHDDFDALLRDLNMEIDEGLAPRKNLPALRRIRDFITPEEDNEGSYTLHP